MRLVIADDSALIRDGLRKLLPAHGFEVAAAAVNVPALLESIEQTEPDVALIDIRMPPTYTTEGITAFPDNHVEVQAYARRRVKTAALSPERNYTVLARFAYGPAGPQALADLTTFQAQPRACSSASDASDDRSSGRVSVGPMCDPGRRYAIE
jgi:Response regulator receiver domain